MKIEKLLFPKRVLLHQKTEMQNLKLCVAFSLLRASCGEVQWILEDTVKRKKERGKISVSLRMPCSHLVVQWRLIYPEHTWGKEIEDLLDCACV